MGSNEVVFRHVRELFATDSSAQELQRPISEANEYACYATFGSDLKSVVGLCVAIEFSAEIIRVVICEHFQRGSFRIL